MRPATTVTDLDITLDLDRTYEADLTLAISWDPTNDLIESATVRPWGQSDGEEPFPLGLLWLIAEPEELLELLHEAQERDDMSADDDEEDE